MSSGGSGVPSINFFAHRVRAGDGAWADFEQMLALLVQATEGHAHLIHSNPGDWGIDVLVGDMSGRVALWQAKYYINGVRASINAISRSHSIRRCAVPMRRDIKSSAGCCVSPPAST
jgi:hypothetical protein